MNPIDPLKDNTEATLLSMADIIIEDIENEYSTELIPILKGKALGEYIDFLPPNDLHLILNIKLPPLIENELKKRIYDLEYKGKTIAVPK